jgi:hypothetical protein
MLPELHGLLREVIYKRGAIDPSEVDVSFDPPTKEWVDGLVRPTLNLSLVDAQENLMLRNVTPQTVRTNGHAQVRMPPRRMDLRYMVTAITSDAEDSQRLLWRALVTLMRTPELSPESLSDEVRQQIDAPLVLRVASPDLGLNVLDFWSAVGIEARPAFVCVLTVPVDLEIVIEEPLVLARASSFVQKGVPGASPRVFLDIGGVVRDQAADALPDVSVSLVGIGREVRTDPEGRFVLRNVPEGKVTFRVAAPDGKLAEFAMQIPSESYDLRLE